jgi:hypothetical protein
MQQRKGRSGRCEGLAGEGRDHERVLPAREQYGSMRKLRCSFAQDVDGLVLQQIKMTELIVGHGL